MSLSRAKRKAVVATIATVAMVALLGSAVRSARSPGHGSRPAFVHDAYLWPRVWSESVAAAVEHAPAELAALRVLALEVTVAPRKANAIKVDVQALLRSRRPIVAVMRVDGTAPLDDVSLAPIAETAKRWQNAGVRVRGIEIDHDCATAKLPEYAAWLARERAWVGSRELSMTALPAWTGSPDLTPLLATADYAVVQVHTVAAPTLFDPTAARRALQAWSEVSSRPFRAALPTYRVRLASGDELAAEPHVLAAFLRDLNQRPIDGLVGITWFRLGHADDPRSFSAGTVAALIRGELPSANITAELRPVSTAGADIVLANHGATDALLPALIHVGGDVDVVEGVRGFVADGRSLRARGRAPLRPGESVVVGFAVGKELSVALP